MNNGAITAEIGKKLAKDFEPEYRVFFDHGKASINRNVKACIALLSNAPSNATRVADVDIVICDRNYPKNKTVVAIIEIEESGFSPKKILGDIFSLMLAKYISIKGDGRKPDVYKIDKDTSKHIFGVVKSQGSKSEQINDNLLPALEKNLTKDICSKIPRVTVLKEGDDICSEVIKVVKNDINSRRAK